MSDDSYPNADIAKNITLDEGIRINGEELPYFIADNIAIQEIGNGDLYMVTVTFCADSVTIGDVPDTTNITRISGTGTGRAGMGVAVMRQMLETLEHHGSRVSYKTEPVFTREQWEAITKAAQ